ERIPVTYHRHAFGVCGNGEVKRVPARGLFAFRDLGAKHAIIVGVSGQRGEDLLAVDDPAAFHGSRLSAERHTTGRGRAAFGERLRVDGALLDNALVGAGAPWLV